MHIYSFIGFAVTEQLGMNMKKIKKNVRDMYNNTVIVFMRNN